MAFAVLAETILCWVGDTYGKSGADFYMNLPASIMFVWHTPMLMFFPQGSRFLVGTFQFFVLFWVAGWMIQFFFSKHET